MDRKRKSGKRAALLLVASLFLAPANISAQEIGAAQAAAYQRWLGEASELLARLDRARGDLAQANGALLNAVQAGDRSDDAKRSIGATIEQARGGNAAVERDLACCLPATDESPEKIAAARAGYVVYLERYAGQNSGLIVKTERALDLMDAGDGAGAIRHIGDNRLRIQAMTFEREAAFHEARLPLIHSGHPHQHLLAAVVQSDHAMAVLVDRLRGTFFGADDAPSAETVRKAVESHLSAADEGIRKALLANNMTRRGYFKWVEETEPGEEHRKSFMLLLDYYDATVELEANIVGALKSLAALIVPADGTESDVATIQAAIRDLDPLFGQRRKLDSLRNDASKNLRESAPPAD